MAVEQRGKSPSHDSITHAYLLEQINTNARELRCWFVKLFFAILGIGGTIIVSLIGALIALIIAIVNNP